MGLLDGEVPPPPSPWLKRIALVLVVTLVAGGLVYWKLRFYRERRQVERFMDALVAGDYQTAYKLWKPTPSYTYQSFLEDWGETNPFGRIRSYEIVDITTGPPEVGVRGGRTLVLGEESSGVIVSVRLNGAGAPVRIWVESRDLSLSFPPF